MKKIPTLFRRSGSGAGTHLLSEAKPECQWVLDGEGIPTRKFDGTCVCMTEDGRWWARREVKKGKRQPEGFHEVGYDPATEKFVGWEPIEQSSFVKFWREASHENFGATFGPGTYELIGPKVNGNPEGYDHHELIEHASSPVIPEPIGGRTFDGLKALLTSDAFEFEGIVWHHPDGRMAKLKVRDFR